MDEPETKENDRKQFNVRLNDKAAAQLDELAELLNMSKGAIVKQAVAMLYARTFPSEKPPPSPP